MKKIGFIASIISLVFFSGCGDTTMIESISSDNAANATTSITANVTSPMYDKLGIPDSKNGEYDVDLTQLNANMVFAQVYDMVYNSENYMGKKIRIKGPFAYYQETDGREFFAVVITDAPGCCSQGIEFVLDGDYLNISFAI